MPLEHPLEVSVGVLWEDRERHFNHHRNVMTKLDSIIDRLSTLPCDKHDGERKLLEARIKNIENAPKQELRFIYITMLLCGIIGGAIGSGSIDAWKLVSRIIGA